MEAVLDRPARRILPLLGLLLAAGGIVLIAWVAYSALKPQPAPYRYQLVAGPTAAGLGKLDTKAWPNLKVQQYEMLVGGVDKPVATMHVARRGADAPVMLDWDNSTDQPVGSLDVSFSDLASVANAIETHAPKDALVLAWWDTSRVIALLSGRKAVFDSHIAEPLILPSFWKSQSAAIGKYEGGFWGARPSTDQESRFTRFADALTDDVTRGAAALHTLVGGREAYIVVDIADLYKAGLMRPDRLDIASRIFPLNTDIHGDISTVDQWERQKKYSAYGLQKLPRDRVRAYFLADARSGKTLLAQMLPLTTSNPPALRAVQLVYQHGNYWVFKLPAVKPASSR